MRLPRVRVKGPAYYHCYSRVVDGLFIFQGDSPDCPESEIFLSMMRRWEAFTGVQVLDYVLIGNHFHLECLEPEPRYVSKSEVLERVEKGFGSAFADELREQLGRFAGQPDEVEQAEALLDTYRSRMFNISAFFQGLKGGYAQSYNRRHNRYGALWAERFKSTLLEKGRAVATVAAYIDLNPVRAKLCEDPVNYPYCGYAEAIGKGATLAVEGLRMALGLPETANREEVLKAYGKLLHLKGSGTTEKDPPTLDSAEAQQVAEQDNGELPVARRLRRKIRYFTDGLILGSYSFVESHYLWLKEKFGYHRASGPKALEVFGLAGLWVLRNLRARTFD
jgi:putative transposase